jgi:HK97 family phage major capsid protein
MNTTVKVLVKTDEVAVVGGMGVVFGGKDLYGETFTAETDFMLDFVPHKPVLYEHALKSEVTHVIGNVTKVESRPDGLWVEAELDRHKAYVKEVLALVERGALGWSSGTVPQLMAMEGAFVRRWPVVEFSLTPTPAEPRTLGVETIRALIESDPLFETLLPEDDAAASSATVGDDETPDKTDVTPVTPIETETEKEVVPQTTEEDDMEQEAIPTAETTELATVRQELSELRSMLANEPAINTPALNLKTRLGDSEVKATAHYLRTGDSSALRASNATDMNIGTPADGGYAVPRGMYNGIIAKRDAGMLTDTLGVMRLPGSGTTIDVPYETGTTNEFVATAEAAAFDLDAPALGQKTFTLVKYTKKVTFSVEVLRDSNDARLVDFVNAYVGRALAITHNKLLVTEALASGTSVALSTAAALAAGDVQKVYYALKQQYVGEASWLMRGATYSALMSLSGNPFQYAETPGGSRNYTLWGAPVYRDENLGPVATTQKSILFGNFGYMGLYEDEAMTFLRDPYSAAGTGQVNFFFYFRAKYGVLLPEAILYGQHP